MCSRTWESPASSARSPREPAPTKNPRAADRTEPMCSVTTRSPESSVVSLCSGSELPAVGIAVAARAPVAVAPAAAAVAPRAAVAVAAPLAPAAVAHRRVAGADGGELVLRLARDVRVGREAQADPAALLVDLDDADRDVVALVEHLLDRRDPLAGRDVRDVQQAVGALGELDEGAERRRLDDLGGRELVADLDLLGHRADPVDQGVALRAGLGVDEHVALVVDVDLRVELVAQAADRLAALADQQADLVRVDLDRRDPRGELRELAARRLDDLGHLAEDVR